MWDVAIVGAGPAGASCAFYLARRGIRVLLLDKARFPREKVCGNLLDPAAQRHLQRMGILGGLLARGEALYSRDLMAWAEGRSFDPAAAVPRRNLLVKRIVLDERLVRAAQAAGARLVEDAPVRAVERAASGWVVRWGEGCASARALVLADGAQSRLARSLGIVTGAPQAVCSAAYVGAGSHRFERDELFVLEGALLPGYASLFRMPGGELNYCCYLPPGGASGGRALGRLHLSLPGTNEVLRSSLGDRPAIGPMRAGTLRLGGVARSHGEGVLVVGDAAGQVDPLSGGGIHYAMDAGELAATTLVAAFEAGDFGESVMAAYHRGWTERWGVGFARSWAALGVRATPLTLAKPAPAAPPCPPPPAPPARRPR